VSSASIHARDDGHGHSQANGLFEGDVTEQDWYKHLCAEFQHRNQAQEQPFMDIAEKNPPLPKDEGLCCGMGGIGSGDGQESMTVATDVGYSAFVTMTS
jgi:hypothetical protein